MITTKTLMQVSSDQKAWATPAQVDAINKILSTKNNKFAQVIGYMPDSNWEVRPIHDITLLTKFSKESLYEKKKLELQKLNGLSSSILSNVIKDEVLNKMTVSDIFDLFETAKNELLTSVNVTLQGDRSDAYRQGHDRCYLHLGDGVKLHYVTEKNKADGLMHPVLTDGFPTINSIMLTYVEVYKKTIKEGVYKTVNSRPLTRMKNIIEKSINVPDIKTLSLKHDNFQGFGIDENVIISEDLKPYAT